MIPYGKKINYLSTIIRREVDNLDAMKMVENVSGANGFILVYIYKHESENVYQKDIEHAFGITRSTCSKVISLMEKKDMIIRKGVDNDQRLKQLCLTDKAKDFVAKVEADLTKFEERLMDGISEDDRSRLLEILGKMEKNLVSRGNEKCVD